MKRLAMKKLRELLRLKFDLKLTHRQIGRALNISPGSVSYYVRAANAAGVAWPLDEKFDDKYLGEKLASQFKKISQPKTQYIEPDWAQVQQRLAQKHMTLALIWEEYAKPITNKAYSYAQFTRRYKIWSNKNKISLRLEHIPGDKAFIDYSGDTIPIFCQKTKEVLFQAQIFIMVLGASNYTFAYASASQKLPDWIDAHVRAFEFFGGCSRLLVPDNLLSGISDSCQFEPLANPTYADLAQHYRTAILPARPKRPKDKAKAESGVLLAQRWIIARLAKQRFYNLATLNNAIKELLTSLNHRQFQKKPGSRYSRFIEEERQALLPLPKTRYEFAQFKTLRVPRDYHIFIEQHYYSVPYTLVGEEVICRYTATTIEILHNHQRVASHLRSFIPDKKTTCKEHMPLFHREYATWTTEVFLEWAKHIGTGVLNFAQAIISKKSHQEQCSRIHFGLKRLCKTYGAERLEKACYRALATDCVQFRSVESILKSGLDKQPALRLAHQNPTPSHPNVRGANYYSTKTL